MERKKGVFHYLFTLVLIQCPYLTSFYLPAPLSADAMWQNWRETVIRGMGVVRGSGWLPIFDV